MVDGLLTIVCQMVPNVNGLIAAEMVAAVTIRPMCPPMGPLRHTICECGWFGAIHGGACHVKVSTPAHAAPRGIVVTLESV